MIGTFTTTKYASREDWLGRRSSGVFVCRNRFTNDGLHWFWRMVLGDVRNADGGLTDQLKSARIVVGDGAKAFEGPDSRLAGEQTAQADMDAGFPALVGMVSDPAEPQGTEPDCCRVSFKSTFGEDQAIFDWQERGVVTAQGVLLDRAVKDQGRKVLGSVWELQADLDLDRGD